MDGSDVAEAILARADQSAQLGRKGGCRQGDDVYRLTYAVRRG